MLDKHHDLIKSLLGSSFIVIMSAFVYIAAYYYERSYLIRLDVPKEYAVAISEVKPITYISLLAAFAGIISAAALLYLALARVSKITEVFERVKNSLAGYTIFKRGQKSLLAKSALAVLGLYAMLVIFAMLASGLGTISAEIGKPLPKVRHQNVTYGLVREYNNRIIVTSHDPQTAKPVFKVIYTSGIESLELVE